MVNVLVGIWSNLCYHWDDDIQESYVQDTDIVLKKHL